MNEHSILVVEDEALIAAQLLHALSSLGYTVHATVATGEDAIRAVTSKKPDLILMDIELLGPMNGIEAARKIREIAEIPIIYLTAYTDDLRLKQAKLTEPYGYIVKPAHNRELNATIEMALYKHAIDRKLKESEEKYHSIFNNAVIGIYQVSPEGRFLSVNDHAAHILGYKSAEELIQSITNIDTQVYQDPKYRDEARRILQENGVVENFEVPCCHKDGHTVWISLNARLVRDPEGHILYHEGTCQDITGRKLMEKALQENEEKFQTVADFTYDWEFWIGPDGKFLYVSPSCERISGYRPEEFMLDQDLLATILHNEDRDQLIDHLYQKKSSPDEKIALEFRIITRNGEERWIGHVCQPVFGANGEYRGIRGSNRDITDRKKAEEIIAAALKRTLDQQAALGTISVSPHLFSGEVYGLSTRLTEVSSRALGVDRASMWVFNKTGDELHCMDLYEKQYDLHTYADELKRPDYSNEFDALRTAMYIDAADPLTDPRTAGYGESYLIPNRITSMLDAVIRVSGQNLGVIRFEHTDCSHHWKNDEIRFACQIADHAAITLLNRDRKLAEEAAREANKKLHILSGITLHDINIELTVMMRYISMLDIEQPGARFKEYLAKVLTAARRICTMVRFTKEYGQIGAQAPVWQDFPTIVDYEAKEVPLGKVTVINDLPAGTEGFADPLINKVFYNLMDNAVRHGGNITTIRFSVEQQRDDLLLVCEDDGEGIPAGEKEKIFEWGFGKSTGLGLTLSREILDITGITIRETGKPGTGARFEIVVPKGMWRIAGNGGK